MALIEFTDRGLYCAQGDFYIDPWRPVNKAVITHAHSDHARSGSNSYLCHTQTKPLLYLRLGNINCQSVEWNEPIFINSVKVSLHPAGHIIGSSQIRVEYNGEVYVASGDYKTEDDGLSGQFEAVKCHAFITESTFGLPIYRWEPQQKIYEDIQRWIKHNQSNNVTSIISAYSLGKAQRVLQAVAPVTNTIYVHGAIWSVQQTLLKAGWQLPEVHQITNEIKKEDLKGSVVIAPPSAQDSPWLKRFGDYEMGVCSGWMQVRGNSRRMNADAGFPLSDHADWPGLLAAIKATGAQKVIATHGFQAALSRYLNEHAIEAKEATTEYGNDERGNETITVNE
ncbi:ligase-associated DNA damage response exonuclease [Chitinophagaceae bacterium LWZ2-11]